MKITGAGVISAFMVAALLTAATLSLTVATVATVAYRSRVKQAPAGPVSDALRYAPMPKRIDPPMFRPLDAATPSLAKS
jgi:hypothetical protein